MGGCIEDPNGDAGDEYDGDDLLPSWEDDVYRHAPFDPIDLDHMCSKFYDCEDGENARFCLDDDPATTLAQHGGIARGAKLAIFDALKAETSLGITLAGNGVSGFVFVSCVWHRRGWVVV